jgi:hypothetical protein
MQQTDEGGSTLSENEVAQMDLYLENGLMLLA